MISKMQAKLGRILIKFSKLENIEKSICCAGLICGLAIFANWYSDFDVYQNGVSYNGFEGPASFNSFAICLSSFFLGLSFLSEKLEACKHKLEISLRRLINYQVAFVAFNMICYISTSLHRDVGVNPNYKEFGMGFELNILVLFYLCLLSFRYLQEESVQVSKYIMMDKDLKIEDVVRKHSAPDLSHQYQKQQELASRIAEKQSNHFQSYHQDI